MTADITAFREGEEPIVFPCKYCGQLPTLIRGQSLYPDIDRLQKKYFYKCYPCDAFVGCHPETKDALGYPAKADLRKARSAVHAVFDRLWKKPGGVMSRAHAYRKLGRFMGLSWHTCHVAMFDGEQCRKALEWCSSQIVEK